MRQHAVHTKRGGSLDIQSNIILYNGEDITDSLASCDFDAQRNKYQVKYNKGYKVYYFNTESLIWFQNPSHIDPCAVALYIEGRLQTNMESVLDFGEYIRIIYQYGAPKRYRKDKISFDSHIPKTPDAKSVLEYFKKVSLFVSIKDENNQSFLAREYE